MAINVNGLVRVIGTLFWADSTRRYSKKRAGFLYSIFLSVHSKHKKTNKMKENVQRRA